MRSALLKPWFWLAGEKKGKKRHYYRSTIVTCWENRSWDPASLCTCCKSREREQTRHILGSASTSKHLFIYLYLSSTRVEKYRLRFELECRARAHVCVYVRQPDAALWWNDGQGAERCWASECKYSGGEGSSWPTFSCVKGIFLFQALRQQD